MCEASVALGAFCFWMPLTYHPDVASLFPSSLSISIPCLLSLGATLACADVAIPKAPNMFSTRELKEAEGGCGMRGVPRGDATWQGGVQGRRR